MLADRRFGGLMLAASFVALSGCSSSTEVNRAPQFDGLTVVLTINRPQISTGGVVTATLTFANANASAISLSYQGNADPRPAASNDNLAEDSSESIFGRDPDPSEPHVVTIAAHRSASFDFHFTGAHPGDSEIAFIYPIYLSSGFATYKVSKSVVVT